MNYKLKKKLQEGVKVQKNLDALDKAIQAIKDTRLVKPLK